MSNRYTVKDLRNLCDRLNTLTGNALQEYTTNPDGKGMSANIGNFHISQAYGGHVPAKELYNQMQAYISGIEDSKEGTK